MKILNNIGMLGFITITFVIFSIYGFSKSAKENYYSFTKWYYEYATNTNVNNVKKNNNSKSYKADYKFTVWDFSNEFFANNPQKENLFGIYAHNKEFEIKYKLYHGKRIELTGIYEKYIPGFWLEATTLSDYQNGESTYGGGISCSLSNLYSKNKSLFNLNIDSLNNFDTITIIGTFKSITNLTEFGYNAFFDNCIVVGDKININTNDIIPENER